MRFRAGARALRVAGTLLGLGVAACDRGGPGARAAEAGIGPSWAGAPGADLCRLVQRPTPLPGEVHESSGAAASRRHPGIVWTHNDSKAPVLFAVGTAGKLVGRVRVTGAGKGDTEDLQLAPCGRGDCLYLADIGDNDAKRREIAVYRFPEPVPGAAATGPAERLAARYREGPQDAEALFVLPPGQVYIVTKGETGPIALYRLPDSARPGMVATLERVRVLAPGKVRRPDRVTGASASPDGKWVALRTLHSLSIYPARELITGRDPKPREVDLAALKEPQGEGVSLGSDGSVVLTSEGGRKDGSATLARLKCTL